MRLFLSADVGFKKPQKEFFEYVYNEIKKELNIDKSDILFFDDSKGHIKSAKAFGLDAYFYENFEEFKQIINKTFDL